MAYTDARLKLDLEELIGDMNALPTYLLESILTVDGLRKLSYAGRVKYVTFVYNNPIPPDIAWTILRKCGTSEKSIKKCEVIYKTIEKASPTSPYRTEYFGYDIIQKMYTDMNGKPRTVKCCHVKQVSKHKGVKTGRLFQVSGMAQPSGSGMQEKQEAAVSIPPMSPISDREMVAAFDSTMLEYEQQMKLDTTCCGGAEDKPNVVVETTQHIANIEIPSHVLTRSQTKRRKELTSPAKHSPKIRKTSEPLDKEITDLLAKTPMKKAAKCAVNLFADDPLVNSDNNAGAVVQRCSPTLQVSNCVLRLCGDWADRLFVSNCKADSVQVYEMQQSVNLCRSVAGPVKYQVKCHNACSPKIQTKGDVVLVCGEATGDSLLVEFCNKRGTGVYYTRAAVFDSTPKGVGEQQVQCPPRTM